MPQNIRPLIGTGSDRSAVINAPSIRLNVRRSTQGTAMITSVLSESTIEETADVDLQRKVGKGLMRMIWHDLLFMHWRVDAGQLRRHLPDSLTLDTFEGDAWIGVVPFRMSDVSLTGVPALPRLSKFPELNVRTYVVGPDGRSGVWFYSLDATNPIAVRGARWLYCRTMSTRRWAAAVTIRMIMTLGSATIVRAHIAVSQPRI